MLQRVRYANTVFAAGSVFQNGRRSRRGIRLALLIALLAMFGLSLIAGWHVAPTSHGHAGAASDSAVQVQHDNDDEDAPGHLAAHATLHSIDLPPVALTVVSQPFAATIWHASLFVLGPLAAPAMDIRPPRS